MTRSHRLRPRWKINWSAVVGVLLIVVAAYTAGETYHQGEEAQRRAECQTSLNRTFLEALQGRDRAAREESNAQRVLLATPAASTDRQKQAARQRYIDALAQLDIARERNPFPKETSC
ncbi:hypothetical protein [Actinomycetospora sp. CA-053990]|uniref:hypothetical protein n=1 Tax=Actinomycetospora sp. CA-053990 TaxID=3239891 RepID=UPI003D9179B1